MRACWLKWVGRDWSISADYIWLNYSDANSAAVIDEETVWYGTIPLLAFPKKEDRSIRFKSNEVAAEFLSEIQQ